MFGKLIPLLVAPALVLAQVPAATPGDTMFHPISLQDAVRLARDNNVAGVTSANAIRTAQNTVRTARAGYYPTLNATAGQSRSTGDRVGPQNTVIPVASAWNYNTGLNSSLTLFDAGKTFADIRQRKADVETQEALQTTTLFALTLQVKTTYNSILAANESEAAGRAQLALAQEQLTTAIAKLNAGATTVSDSFRYVVAVGNARLAILSARTAAQAASATLTRYVATPYLVTAVASDTAALPITPIDSTAIMRMALDGPGIRQYQAQIASAVALERSVKTQYLPTVSAALSYGGTGVSSLYGLNNNPFPFNKSVSVSASYPIFNRWQRETSVASAQIAHDNAEAQLRDQKLGTEASVIAEIGALRNAEEQMRVQQLNVRLDEEDLRVQQQRYALGAGLLLDLLQSQSNLITARQQLIQARLNYRNSRAQIEAIIGRDLP
jgi:outer membrane protein TolC